ncbi:MAG: branched-chain amino acid ABC transporter permease [Burkholderiaceae bacterium]|jgi:branched-chain amino acid transport system permease protein|nr:branched-chain amino acid ABC transporter permease [Burkholderiaceae bacterium]
MELVQAIVNGLLIGGVYAVISIGLTLVFGVMSIINFAQAEFLMIGMFVGYYCWLYLGIDPLLGAGVAFVVAFVLGMLIQRVLIERIIGAPDIAQIFLTVGLLILLENLALVLFGSDYKSVRTPYQTSAIAFAGLIISLPYLFAFLVSVVVGIALWAFLRYTWIGQAMRATAQNGIAALSLGIDVRRVRQLAFGLGVGLTALGGSVILPYYTASPTAGGQFVVLMFTVVVLGGLGSVLGAVFGGLAVGVIQSISALLMPIQLQNLALFVVFIAVLAVRPQGLLSTR